MLLLSKDALLKFTAGHVINLISNDVQRMEEDSHVAFHIDFFVLCLGCDNSVTGVFDWLAFSYGSLLLFSCAIFRWVLLY